MATLSMLVLLVAAFGVTGGALRYRRQRAERERAQRELLRALGEALARAKGSPDERTLELLVTGLYGMATQGPTVTLMTTMADLLNASDAPKPRSARLALSSDAPTEPLSGWGSDGRRDVSL